MVTSVLAEEAVFEAENVVLCVSSGLHSKGIDDLFGGHSIVDHVLKLSFVVLVLEEFFFSCAEEHGVVAVAETAETVFFTALEDVKSIAVCVI